MLQKEKGDEKLDNLQIKIAIGGLLHDVGKLLYRYNDGRNHCISGYEFLKENGIEDEEILKQVKCHHAATIKNASLPEDSPAYVTYWADNVAAGADRRNKEDSDQEKDRFEKDMPLESVFNILNGNNQNYTYEMAEIFDSGEINYPSQDRKKYDESKYNKIIQNIKDGIKSIEFTQEYVNSLIGVLEGNMSFVPSSTNTGQLADISLFDHVKITAAIGGCMYAYLSENGITDYKNALFIKAAEMYDKKTFRIASIDISGIQDFIYTIHSKDALKTLRAKSFYLEMLLEHVVDELLERYGLSRANLIYSGGGHAYLILPNTSQSEQLLHDFFAELRLWMMENFGTSLYVAYGSAECSANDLMDMPAGSYRTVFEKASQNVSENKRKRYSAEEILSLNSQERKEFERECRICKTTENLNSDNLCPMCNSYVQLSKKIQNEKFITVCSQKQDESAAILPFGRYMTLESEEKLRKRVKEDPTYVRAYSKNRLYTGFNVSTRLWIGDYNNGDSFEKLADSAQGIKRLGVLRGDVDSLGKAFVSGFNGKDNTSQYSGLSRSATFSRKLSMFFKLNINYILGTGGFFLTDKSSYPMRNAVIVYSGGDDVFIVGAWNEIIEAGIDINEALKKYSQGMLTISAGIGIFPPKFPVEALARQTGELEDASKLMEGKNAITVFDEENTYHWEVFKEKVVGEKLKLLEKYFDQYSERGNSQLYTIMEYVRNSKEKINIARLAYHLGRIEPSEDDSAERKAVYNEFSRCLYRWTKDAEERRQLLTAIYLYIYLNREKKEEKR